MLNYSRHESDVIAARTFGTVALMTLALGMAMLGCEKRERVLDVKTPAGGVEIDKTTNPDGSKSLEIQTE